MRNVKVIQSSMIYFGDINLRKDKFSLNGKVVDKEIVGHQDSVGIVAVRGSSVILITQYRQAAIREMAEEIGCSGTLRPLLKWYLAPGYSTELMHIFVATNLREITRGLLDNDENIEIRKMRLSAAIKKCLNGNIEDAKTIAALLAYYSQSN